jgi:hypothetical protein
MLTDRWRLRVAMQSWALRIAKSTLFLSVAGLSLGSIIFPPLLRAQNREEIDSNKFTVLGYWWFSQPRGHFESKVGAGSLPIDSSTGFSSYSSFSGRFDWRFKRKHHLLVDVTPTFTSKSIILTRTVEFKGVTYAAGGGVSVGMTNLAFSPGYQWDFIRRSRGHLGLVVQINLLNVSGHIDGIGVITGPSGTNTARVNSSGSIFAPLPVLGPDFRLYFWPHSDRWYVDGFLKGLYFFGYGSFISSRTTIGVRLAKHIDLDAGYQLGSRLVVDGSDTKVRLTQKGPIAGLQFRW